MTIRAITFDATGTLFHAPRLGAIYSEVLGRHGVEVGAGEAAELVRRVWLEFDCASEPARDRFAAHPEGARGWWKRFLDRFCAHLGDGSAPPFAAAELYERFAGADAWEVFGEVPAVLERLALRGFELGVVSNWDERLPRVLDRLGLAGKFRVVSYSQAVGVEKPHAAIFRHALDGIGVEPDQTLHVGDRRRHDVEGAEAVGMRALHLDRVRKGGDIARLDGLLGWLRTDTERG